jgi:hypothetical protein
MTATTAGQRRLRIVGRAAVTAYAGAAAFVIAGSWFLLVTKDLTVVPAPRIAPSMPAEQGMRTYYRWLATTLPQERYYVSIGIAGFACLAAAALSSRNLTDRDHALTRTAGLLVGAGSLLWITGSVLELGGHHAVGMMATHSNPIEFTNSIAFTVDMIAAAFAVAAFTALGAGMLAFAAAAAAKHTRYRAWLGYTIFTALAMLVTAGCYTAGNDNVLDLMLVADGVVLLPGWLIWTANAGGSELSHTASADAVPLARSISHGSSDDLS